ncbi:hypothetical protein OG21DRAFT_1480124 [Imleria badia]|nr:hypothetical protein OG21DRAFT_1480124 [Imleria badia]
MSPSAPCRKVFDIPRNISVPSTAFVNNQGAYQISPIPFTKGAQFLLTMSDATGFGTGGTSELLTVGAPVGSASCNTSDPALPFSFSLPSSLEQCSAYVFNGYDGAILPVTITGFIPGGDVFFLNPPSTGTSFTWVADVAAGTTVIFTMTDAQGHSGGSSDTETVALSNTASCLSANSPSSTASIPSSTTTSSSTSSPMQTSKSSGVSSGIIAGAAVGAVGVITAIIALAACYLKRRRYGRLPYGLAPTRKRRPNSVDLDPDNDNFQQPPIFPFPYQTDSVSRLAPPIIPGSPAAPASYQETSSTSPSVYPSEAPYMHQQHSRTSSNTDSFAAFGDIGSSTMSSSGRRKAALAGITGHQPTTRFIVHTDAEDPVSEREVEVVELPPQYSERQTVGTTHLSSVSGLSSTDLAYLSGQHVCEPPRSIPSGYRPPE